MRAADRGAAIVTGGGGAIGGAACDGLAERGFAVLVVDLDGAAAEAVAARIVAAGGTASACAADVSDEDAVAAYVRACVERHGAPRAFFNNAAAEGAIAPISDYPTDVFDRTMAINVRGVFLGLKHVIPAMRAAGGVDRQHVLAGRHPRGRRPLRLLGQQARGRRPQPRRGARGGAGHPGQLPRARADGHADDGRHRADGPRRRAATRPASSTASRPAATAGPRRSRPRRSGCWPTRRSS